MLTKINPLDRRMPQKNLSTDQDAVRRAAKAARRAKLAKKAKRKGRGRSIVIPQNIADRMGTPAKPAPKSVVVVLVSLHPKEEALRFEDNPFYYGYRRRTCSGESCNGTRS